MYGTRCQLKISLGIAWKESRIIYSLAICFVEYKGEKTVAFPCHVPQDTVYFEANASNGYCLSFCSVKRDGDLGANTRTGEIPSLFGEDLTAQELVSLLCPAAALICSRLFCKMNLQKIGNCIVHLGSESVGPLVTWHWRDLGNHPASFSWT